MADMYTKPRVRDADPFLFVAVAAAVGVVLIVFAMWFVFAPNDEYMECFTSQRLAYVVDDGTPSEASQYARIVCRDLR